MQKFIDVSNNNGPNVDFVACKKAGAVAVYLKVTEGTGFVDADYPANYKRAKAAGLKVGGYHFGHPNSNPAQEAAFFLQHLKLVPGDLKPCLDLEVSDDQISTKVSAYAKRFLGILKHRTGELGVLYSGSYFMSANHLLDIPEKKWIASYGAAPKTKWDAWQFSDGEPRYPGSINHLDTSTTASIYLFVYKAPLHKKVKAHVTKWVWVHVGGQSYKLKTGTAFYKWFMKHLKQLGKLGKQSARLKAV